MDGEICGVVVWMRTGHDGKSGEENGRWVREGVVDVEVRERLWTLIGEMSGSEWT